MFKNKSAGIWSLNLGGGAVRVKHLCVVKGKNKIFLKNFVAILSFSLNLNDVNCEQLLLWNRNKKNSESPGRNPKEFSNRLAEIRRELIKSVFSSRSHKILITWFKQFSVEFLLSHWKHLCRSVICWKCVQLSPLSPCFVSYHRRWGIPWKKTWKMTILSLSRCAKAENIKSIPTIWLESGNHTKTGTSIRIFLKSSKAKNVKMKAQLATSSLEWWQSVSKNTSQSDYKQFRKTKKLNWWILKLKAIVNVLILKRKLTTLLKQEVWKTKWKSNKDSKFSKQIKNYLKTGVFFWKIGTLKEFQKSLVQKLREIQENNFSINSTIIWLTLKFLVCLFLVEVSVQFFRTSLLFLRQCRANFFRLRRIVFFSIFRGAPQIFEPPNF